MINESSKDRWLLILIFLAMSIIPGFLFYTKIKENIDKGSIPANFNVTELVSDNLPDSIEFWTTAYCPDAGTEYDYTVPQGYKVSSCVYGGNGSHGGCSGCVMTKIKLVKIEAGEYHEETSVKEKLSTTPDIFPPIVLSPEEGYVFKRDGYIQQYNKFVADYNSRMRDLTTSQVWMKPENYPEYIEDYDLSDSDRAITKDKEELKLPNL